MIFRNCLSTRFLSSIDINPCALKGVAYITWSKDLTEVEVRAYTIRRANTSARFNQIIIELHVTCWENIQRLVCKFIEPVSVLFFNHNVSNLLKKLFFQKLDGIYHKWRKRDRYRYFFRKGFGEDSGEKYFTFCNYIAYSWSSEISSTSQIIIKWYRFMYGAWHRRI